MTAERATKSIHQLTHCPREERAAGDVLTKTIGIDNLAFMAQIA
jgi:hypothetical protein